MAEEEIAQLKRELAAERAKSASLEGELASERAENSHLRQMLEEVLRRLGEVEGKLANDSHTSSKPPSSDGLGRKRVSLRKKSEKKPGGQAGHPGRTLLMAPVQYGPNVQALAVEEPGGSLGLSVG